MTRGLVRAIADTLEAKDRYVYGHARRVSGYSVAVGRRLRLGVGLLEELSLAALMHDVGKIGTPDSILLKPSKLSEEEHAVVRLHSERGARLLAELPEMEEVARAVRYHHEDFDGAGYPEGLAGEQIPLASRIIRVADAYDAMTSPRPFRDALDHDSAVRELSRRAGTQFDPEVVRAFCGLESLSKIRGRIAEGAFGSQFLSVMPPGDLLKLTPAGLLREVEREPALAALVLRAANEGCRAGSETASLPAACERLGDTTLRDIIAGADVSERIAYEAEVLRDHSLRCATAARLLAERAGTLDPDHAYTLGLLHDVGEALLHTLFPEEAEKIAWLGSSGQVEREVAAFGVDHAQVGQWILDACGLPPAFGFIAQTHHDINLVNDPAALLLHAADAVARAHDSSEVAGLEAFTPARLSLLRLKRADLARVHELVTGKIGERFDRAAA
jgi:putative nucleotidyltransferase with HDIG domain